MSLASARATAREVRTALAEAKALREQWAQLEPVIKDFAHNANVSRDVLCRGFWGRLSWLLRGK